MAPEPALFDAKVRIPGLRAIAEMAGKPPAVPRPQGQKKFAQIAGAEQDIPASKFPSFWTEALDELMSAYGRICAYSCFSIHPVTGARSADHFAPKSRRWRDVYEWDNYRLCCSRMNARKNNFSTVLDPFEVKWQWFALELLGFQLQPGPRCPRNRIAAVTATIDTLGLDDADLRAAREEDAQAYWDRAIDLRTLRRLSPFVAHELHRLGKLNAGDAWVSPP